MWIREIDVDNVVDIFTSTDLEIFEPFCKVNERPGRGAKCRSPSTVDDHKPWFNAEIHDRYKVYKYALYKFNRAKTEENYELFLTAKRDYKRLEKRFKAAYLR